ncbi:3-deoxy-D-manno-octulosonic-acid transferase [uncultured Desulfobacterium sp.]|uniref:3-deoxy-D-manno-octulosonic acid transferase n=1 Tax=uncultured Desulfobacterium sp. TaxID=201089 RepID=A0A445MRJ3_9BACT|nr:3-deoxy-D-manno-octulosonic-acid transferase [uncultured Desulfobacterium sp.]
MNKFYLPYTVITSALSVLILPSLWTYTRLSGRYAKNFNERLGLLPSDVVKNISGKPRIWIHAVSLGEVNVAASIINALRRMMPDCSFILSTTTESGRNMAEKTFGHDLPVIYAPIDFIGPVLKSLNSIRPDVMVFLETEIWPTWLYSAHRMGIRTALINGRISQKSIGGYLKFRFFFREVLKNFDAFSMITEKDAERIMSIGAEPDKVEINGNAKYDLLPGAANPAAEGEIRNALNLEKDARALVAGSTRSGEDEQVIHAYKKILRSFPDTILIIAPRHIERTPEICSMLKAHGLEYQLRTGLEMEKRTKQILIINTFGELFKIYSIATIVFSGGSLVPLGGQNPLEPAVWGKPVLYGPYMDNFLDAKAMLEGKDAGVGVRDSETLAEKALWFFNHPEELRRAGERAKSAVMQNEGAAAKHAEVIKRLIKDK